MADDPPRDGFRRLPALWALYARMDLIWMLRDPRSFLTCVGCDLLISLAGVTAVLLLADRFHGIGPWSRREVLFLLGFAALSRGLLDLFFGYNVLHVSRRIGRGQLDHTVVQPQPLWISLLTEGFTPFSGTASLLPGLALLLWSVQRLRIVSPLIWSGWLILNLTGSAVVTLSVSYLTGSLAFWAPRGGEEVSASAVSLFDELRVFPLDGLGMLTRVVLLSALPIGLAAWYPARALLTVTRTSYLASVHTPASWDWRLVVTPAGAVVALLAAVLVFRRGLTHYGCTGSQRYSHFGHRR